jgi:hypothetical protein
VDLRPERDDWDCGQLSGTFVDSVSAREMENFAAQSVGQVEGGRLLGTAALTVQEEGLSR